MEESDMLVTAGGTTLYELSAVGVPGVCFCVADNQKYNVKGFSDENLLLYAGDIREDDFYEKLENSLEILIEDFELRERMSKELQRKTDGQRQKLYGHVYPGLQTATACERQVLRRGVRKISEGNRQYSGMKPSVRAVFCLHLCRGWSVSPMSLS